MESFEKNEKSRKMAVFGLILTMFFTSQSYDFDEITQKGP